MYSKFGEAFRWSKFSQTMLNQSAPENKTAVYIQNITGVHYDVVLAVTSTDTQTYHNNSHNLTDHSVDKILTLEKQCVKNIEVEEDPLSKLKVELNSIGLNPLDIGGGGDRFFRAVSYQICQNPEHHMEIRLAGINYIEKHPEQFIESISDASWIEYIFNMSTPGSWCDGVIVQAVADALNCKIHIIESADNFANINVIYPVSPNETTREICIGHLDEFHYVSTVKTKSYLSD